EDLIRAARAVGEGGAWLDPSVTARVLAAYRESPGTTGAAASGPGSPVPDHLTPRELEVLRLVGRGLSNGEIAEALHVGEVTVKTHIGHVFTKLGVRDRAAAIVFAFDHGLVEPEP